MNAQSRSPLQQTEGFSLLEVLIFVSILSTFFVIAVGVSIASLRNLQFNEHKIIATKSAQDVVEWARGEKDVDWGGTTNAGGSSFTERVTQSGNASNGYRTTFCFSTQTVDTWPNPGACSGAAGNFTNNNMQYTREVVFTSTVTSGVVTTVNMAVTVEWFENGVTNQVPINTLFTLYD